MKVRIVTTSFLLIAVSTLLLSYARGPATNGWDCTGAETGLNNPTGCTNGGGCHANSATAGITVAIQLTDSTGTAVSQYIGGKNYTVTLTGVNTTGSSLPRFGFQLTSIAGSVAQVTPVSAGTWSSTVPQGHVSAPQAGNFVVNLVEQSHAITASSGGGATGSTYVDSFTWTAPVVGTGTVSFWGVLNAVNGTGSADGGDLWNTNSLVITEDTVTHTNTGITTVSQTNQINVYPNPVNDRLNIQVDNAAPGTCLISVFDLSGQLITTQTFETATTHSIGTSSWESGVYLIKIQQAGVSKVLRILKQ